MTLPRNDAAGRRVAILAPTGKDAALTEALLQEAAVEAVVCADLAALRDCVAEGCGALLVAEEALAGDRLRVLADVVAAQPAWSDLPVLLLARYGADSAIVARGLQSLGNVTLLERPLRPTTLISSVRAALRARQRQYEVGRYLEQQLRTNAELEASIRERARVEEALREADRRKDEFLAMLAHELRNPLAPISNSLHILRLKAGRDAAAVQITDMIERQVNHLVRLVDDLMEVSRITRGKVELRTEPVALETVVRTAVEASRPMIEAAQHRLEVLLPDEPLLVDGDPVRLSQVFANLLNNAAKYMNDGGWITLAARRENESVVVSVRDTGIGIAPDMLPHVFKMFTQADRSRRQAQGGLGIGLTLVRTLVEMHGGSVEARSAGEDQGSEFIVTLPLLTGATAAPEKAPPEIALAGLQTQRVLVVDDNRDAAVSLGRLLKILGAEPHVVHDGPAALAAIESFRPSIVLLDIGMPGMDGYEVARRIRQQPALRDLMLIALTGWGQEEDRRRTKSAGFDHHLVKPVDLVLLGELLNLQDTPARP